MCAVTSQKVRHPAPGGDSRCARIRDNPRAGIPARGGAARAGGLLPHLGDMAVLRGRARQLVADGAAAASRRQRAHGRICDALTLPPERAGAFLCAAAGYRTRCKLRRVSSHRGGRHDGRHSCIRRQALHSLRGLSSGRAVRLRARIPGRSSASSVRMSSCASSPPISALRSPAYWQTTRDRGIRTILTEPTRWILRG